MNPHKINLKTYMAVRNERALPTSASPTPPAGNPRWSRRGKLVVAASAAVALTVVASAAVLLHGQSSQPKVTWSTPSLELILSPGDTITRTVMLTSNTSASNIRLEAVPAIAPFLTIQPSSIATISENQPQSVQIVFTIPSNATLGTYYGTIHVRNASQTLPQTMKIVLHAWQAFADSAIQLTFKYPDGWSVDREGGVISLSDRPIATDASSEFAGDILFFRDLNPTHLSLDNFYSTFRGGYLYRDAVDVKPVVIDSVHGLRFTPASGVFPGDIVVLSTQTGDFLRIENRGRSSLFDSVIQTLSLH